MASNKKADFVEMDIENETINCDSQQHSYFTAESHFKKTSRGIKEPSEVDESQDQMFSSTNFDNFIKGADSNQSTRKSGAQLISMKIMMDDMSERLKVVI